MDPLDFLENEELLRFFHCNKTEMSCMENPHTFMRQLRDHDLIPEDRFKKLSRMKSKEVMKKGLYEALDWFETMQPQHIKLFWSCAFKETIINHYPSLRLLRDSLMNGSFHFNTQLPERLEENVTKTPSENKEKEKNPEKPAKKKRKLKHCNAEEEQPGPSNYSPAQKKTSKKIHFSSPSKGEKRDCWNWPIYKFQLPVTCGDQTGTLNRDKLARGKTCILVGKQWLTPSEFEALGGRKSSKNWKLSIRCLDIPLGKLIKEGHLETVSYKGRRKKAKKSLLPSDDFIFASDREDEREQGGDGSSTERETSPGFTDEEEAEEEQPEQPPNTDSMLVFEVTCGELSGKLHTKRFASGNCGRSIRTETSWMSPMEFVREGSSQTEPSWRRDILWEGKPLSVLIEDNRLRIHSPLCKCKQCHLDEKDLEDQKNDDECNVCGGSDEERLVVCDQCPRAFHQMCHLPHIDDTILGDNNEWLCTFCVFATTQRWRYSDELGSEETLSHQISRHMLECQYLLLYLYSVDEEQEFATDPSLYLKDYTTVVKTPMWLGNVAEKLQNVYQTVGEFISDILLIFTNCASYNEENAEFLAKGNRLKTLFDTEMRNVFNIPEDVNL
ncbi:uncharacterized protein sp100.1 [Aulostomus maculatus]